MFRGSHIMLLFLQVLACYSDKLCRKDISDEMFKADLVVLARVKNVSSDAEIQIRISKVIKENQEGQVIKPKKKILVALGLGESCRPQLRPKAKYIFVLSGTGSGWEVQVRPLRPSKKIKRITQNLFCSGCGAGPRMREVSEERGVKLYSLPCRLASGKEPTVRFSWYFNGRLVTGSENYKIRNKRSGSVLNVRGLASTAGLYRCRAVSLAGEASLQVSLYVHGTVSSVCQAGYCLNGGSCSVVTITPGELQPVCNCSQGYAGLRCELKHVTTHFTLTAIIITLASLTLIIAAIVIIYFYKRLRKIEAILRQQDTNQKLLSQKVAAKPDPACRATVHKYQHCGLVRTGVGNGTVRLEVTKSASSPGMSALASSSESVKQRRAGAQDSLALEVCRESARVSPLYTEPWDGLDEADTILSQCLTYSGHQTESSGVFSQ